MGWLLGHRWRDLLAWRDGWEIIGDLGLVTTFRCSVGGGSLPCGAVSGFRGKYGSISCALAALGFNFYLIGIDEDMEEKTIPVN